MHLRAMRRILSGASCVAALSVMVLPGHAAAQSAASTSTGTPAAAAGAGVEPEGFLPEPGFIDHALTSWPRRFGFGSSDGDQVKGGFYPELGNMPTGAGWISAGPGYRQWLFGHRALFDGSAALSWRAYKMIQARFELPGLAGGHLTVGTLARWQDLTQVTFFGEGPDSQDANRSEYRLKSTEVGGYATVQPMAWLTIRGRTSWLDRPSILGHSGKFQRGNPDTRELFADDVVYSLPQQPAFVQAELSVTADSRDHRSHPSSGGVYRAVASTYSDRDGGVFTFHRYEGEAAQFVPVARNRIVLAVHGWVAGSQTAAGDVIPFYLQPSLGGGNTLRGYTDFRYHDRNLAAITVETRLAVFTHIDVAVFADAGNVAAKFRDLDLARRDHGVGLRMHTRDSTFARLDVAHGDEGWRVLFRMSDPLHLARLSRRTAAIPFVP